MKSFFGRRFFNDIISNKKGLIVNCIMQLLGLPVASIIALLVCYREENEANMSQEAIAALENGGFAFMIIAVAAIGISIITAIPTAMTHFSYLHKKAKADMHYALPLNNKQRFFADFLSGLAVYLGPVIAAIILSFAILGIGSIFVDTKLLWDENIIQLLLKIGIVVFLGMLQLYTISVFSLTFCGNGFEAGFSISAFNVLIPATIACMWYAVTEIATFGVVPESLLQMNIFTDTSLVGAAAFIFNFEEYLMAYGDTSNFNSMFAKWIIFNLICTAVYAAAAFFLYRSRKAEDVSKPYVHRSFFYALLTMAVFCVISLFIIGEAPISAGIVICAVGWFVMELITRRGFKRFWTAAVGFVIATAAVFGVIGICVVSDGFGASKRIPSVDSVESVTINFESFYSYNSLKFTDKKVIEEAVKLHQECIDRYFNFDEKDFPTVNEDDNIYLIYDDLFSLTYTTKSGAVFSREYSVTQSMETELIKAILLSEEMAESCAKDIGSHEYHGNSKSMYTVNASHMDHNQYVEMPGEWLTKLRSDLKADLNDMTEEELLEGDVYCYLDQTIFVLESFERTIDDLNNLGFDFSEGAIEDDFSIVVDPVFASYNRLSYSSGERRSEGYDDTDDLSEIDGLCNYMDYLDGGIYNAEENVIDHDNPYTSELMDNMTKFIIGEKPIAVIRSSFGNGYLLKDTEENRKLIENLMKYKIESHDSPDEYEGYYED